MFEYRTYAHDPYFVCRRIGLVLVAWSGANGANNRVEAQLKVSGLSILGYEYVPCHNWTTRCTSWEINAR